jgi:hypothetical protein
MFTVWSVNCIARNVCIQPDLVFLPFDHKESFLIILLIQVFYISCFCHSRLNKGSSESIFNLGLQCLEYFSIYSLGFQFQPAKSNILSQHSSRISQSVKLTWLPLEKAGFAIYVVLTWARGNMWMISGYFSIIACYKQIIIFGSGKCCWNGTVVPCTFWINIVVCLTVKERVLRRILRFCNCNCNWKTVT